MLKIGIWLKFIYLFSYLFFAMKKKRRIKSLNFNYKKYK